LGGEHRFVASADFHAGGARFFYNGLGTTDSGNSAHQSPGKKRCCYDTGSQTNNIFALHIGAVPEHLINDTVGMLVASLKDRNADHPHATTANGEPLGDNEQLERSDTILPPHWIRDSAPPPPFGPGAHVGLLTSTFLTSTFSDAG
jgi:hypothetical protein